MMNRLTVRKRKHPLSRMPSILCSFDYEKYVRKYQDESHGNNPFNYGYIGKFDIRQAPVFGFDTFDTGNQIYTGWKQTGFQDTAVALLHPAP
jgi:hypothetical protein